MSVTGRWPDALAVVGATLLTIFCAGGIGIGYSNHVGLLPVVRRLLNPDYLPGDFGINLWLYHHRVFAMLIAWLARLIGLDSALILLSVLSTGTLCIAVYTVCRSLRLPLTAYVFAAAFLALSVFWTGLGLESNTLIGDREVYPTTIANACALFACAALVARRFRTAAFCAGLAFLFHLQVGVILILVLAPFYLFSRTRPSLNEFLRCLAIWLVPALVGLWHIWQMVDRGVFGPEFGRAFIEFRAPHHFELQSATSAVWVGAALVVQVACYTWLRSARRSEADRVRIVVALSALLAMFALAHFAEYYWTNSVVILKLQLPRISPLITLFGLLVLLTTASAWSRDSNWRRAATWATLTAILALRLIWVLTSGPVPFSLRVHRAAEESTDWASMCRWIERNAPNDSVYLTPPANEGFAYLAERSTVVEYKIDPDGGQMMADWFARLRDMAGGTLPGAHGWDNTFELNRAFDRLSAEQLIALGRKYGARFAVLRTSSPIAFSVLHQDGEYELARLPD